MVLEIGLLLWLWSLYFLLLIKMIFLKIFIRFLVFWVLLGVGGVGEVEWLGLML